MKLAQVLGICVLGGGLAFGCGSDDEFSNDGATGGSAGSSAGKSGSSGSAGSSTGAGGAPESSGGAAAGGDGNEAGATAGGAPSAGGSSSAAGGASGDGGDSGNANGGAPAGGGSNCPDVFGDYTITQADGTCGDFDDEVVQSLEGTDQTCFLHFVSEGALNGGADLDVNGEFADEQLYVGSAQRNPCSAEYDPDDGSMVVTCGGQGDACIVTLEPQ